MTNCCLQETGAVRVGRASSTASHRCEWGGQVSTRVQPTCRILGAPLPRLPRHLCHLKEANAHTTIKTAVH